MTVNDLKILSTETGQAEIEFLHWPGVIDMSRVESAMTLELWRGIRRQNFIELKYLLDQTRSNKYED